MKYFFSILFILSCNGLYGQDSKAFNKYNILGKWRSVATITHDSNKVTLCTICPDITFSSDRFAKVVFKNDDMQNILLADRKKQTVNPYFYGEYLLRLKSGPEYTDLELIQLQKGYTFLLRK